MSLSIALAERGLVPTWLVRHAIRNLCAQRLRELTHPESGAAFLARIAKGAIAEVPHLANEQHYELPSEFFALALGPHLKYSGAIWNDNTRTLDEAEEAMLALTCERAELVNGQDVLELGCGWGSLSLYMARRFPDSRITAVSNSRTQRLYLEAQGLRNLEVITADMNVFETARRFDRIVSVEMFEHMRDWSRLTERVARWLRPGGALFVHVFCHASRAYTFEAEGDDNWMGRYFFSGGIMPSYGLLAEAAPATLTPESDWWINGTHYEKTAAAWRENMENRRDDIMRVLKAHYGGQASVWYHRWRMFFLACEELFGYHGGEEWGVAHYRLRRAHVEAFVER